MTKGNKVNDLIRNEYEFLLQALTDIVNDCKSDMLGYEAEYTQRGDDSPSIDVRLCVDLDKHAPVGNASWIFRTGLADYDTYHSEFCAASSIGLDTDPKVLLENLIDQVMDQAYQGE